jgi:hypothetical protein
MSHAIDESSALKIIDLYNEIGDGINQAALVCDELDSLENRELKAKLFASVHTLLNANYRLYRLVVSHHPHLKID